MKIKEIEKIVEPLIPKIAKVCQQNDAPLGRVVCCGATSVRQRADGVKGTVTVILSDSHPGWRAKDNHAGRSALKNGVQQVFSGLDCDFNVKVQASYSCMQVDNGVVARRNDSGDVIGCYAE